MNKYLESVCYEFVTKEMLVLDQNKLPMEEVYIHIADIDDVFFVIKNLCVRGAPAIGITASFGLLLHAYAYQGKSTYEFYEYMKQASDYLISARPTAINLKDASQKMCQVIRSNLKTNIETLRYYLESEARRQKEEISDICKKIGEHGQILISNSSSVMTYCNAGSLATACAYGTALAPIYYAHDVGKDVSVYVCETRPVLQGARLTSFELIRNQINATLICDNMAASVMKNYRISAVFVGADHIAVNGDVANKIGTYGLALLAKAHNIPFYVCAPTTTISHDTINGNSIPIEMRNNDEISLLWYQNQMVHSNVNIYNPAFDITPHNLITGIITENGIFKAPYHF